MQPNMVSETKTIFGYDVVHMGGKWWKYLTCEEDLILLGFAYNALLVIFLLPHGFRKESTLSSIYASQQLLLVASGFVKPKSSRPTGHN